MIHGKKDGRGRGESKNGWEKRRKEGRKRGRNKRKERKKPRCLVHLRFMKQHVPKRKLGMAFFPPVFFYIHLWVRRHVALRRNTFFQVTSRWKMGRVVLFFPWVMAGCRDDDVGLYQPGVRRCFAARACWCCSCSPLFVLSLASACFVDCAFCCSALLLLMLLLFLLCDAMLLEWLLYGINCIYLNFV